MLERLTPAWRNVLLGALGVLVVAFSWHVRAVLNPLIAGYFLAYVVHPLVVKLERRGFSRKAAVNWIFFGVLLLTLVVGAGVGLQGSRLVREIAAPDGLGAKITARIDAQIERHAPALEGLLAKVFGGAVESPGEADAGSSTEQAEGEPNDESAGTASTDEAAEPAGAFDLATLVRRIAEEIDRDSAVQAGRVGLTAAGGAWAFLSRVFGSVLAVLTFFFLLPVYTWFLLFQLGNIHSFLVRYTPVRERDRVRRIGRQIGEVMANFFRGRLLVALAKGVFLTIGLRLCGIDYALLLGLGSGLFSLVPFVGSFVGGVLAFLVALLEHDVGAALVRVLAIYIAAEIIEGYLLVPKILGDSLGLPPVVVIFAVFVGGAALGVFGLLLALPLTASILILVRELVLPALGEFADEGDNGDRPPPEEVFAGTPPA